jgi:hypothetical protein
MLTLNPTHNVMEEQIMNTYALQTLRHGLLTATLLLTGAANALAFVCGSETPLVDRKVFPATLCRPVGTTSTAEYDHLGRILNPSSTADLTVVCPVDRDATFSPWHSLDIVVADRNPVKDLTCQARSNQQDGFGWWHPITPVKTTGAKYEWWNHDVLTIGSPTQERDLGTFTIVCTLPPKYQTQGASNISSYRIAECSNQTNPG